ncbi:FAD-binding oxidoreductase [Methylovirgula sp. 4M-Z18]|uniref:FAD-binding oxidoreductase n=1 Tax=Methylovirgula sp. 4M-Z18 TaxID=2293567 RepID=UPI001FDEF024|nr:FAD-binding oxidoreductase [Methylovirgula sp. 4M-Z18]
MDRNVLSWGRIDREPQHVAAPRFRSELPALMGSSHAGPRLAAGLRRSYGDSCLNRKGELIDMRNLDRFMAFDPQNGILRAEAGASLTQILELIVPHGWFVPTTPGTQFVTLGGAVANDVHGKNHHRAGTFGCHVRSFGLVRGDGFCGTVARGDHAPLFAATIGGLGLTGIIDWVEIDLKRIPSSYLDVEIVPFGQLDEYWSLEQDSQNFEHSVAWIDTAASPRKFGRGLFSRANWRKDDVYEVRDSSRGLNVMFEAPSFLINSFTVDAFNELYCRVNRGKSGARREHYSSFFYPLDAVHNWNRLYGSRGFFQYQCVVPPNVARSAIERLLKAVIRSRHPSFLGVLKSFGDRSSPGMLSFPRPGTTLALDFPNRGPQTLSLFSELDVIVAEAGGALYPAKDGRMSSDMFRRSFSRWNEFCALRDHGMSSDFWQRVAQNA